MQLTHKAILTTVILAVGGAVPAHAQLLTLQSGDNLTVGSTGTSGTYQGAPIRNSTNSYVGTTNYTDVVTTASNSAFTLNSGGSIANNGSYAGGITATDSLITINGGSISTTFDASDIDATGGTVNITGGTLTGTFALYTNATTVTVSGGTLSGLDGLDETGGTANITGGTFIGVPGSGGSALSNGGGALATISGGSFDQGGFEAGTNGTIDLLGTFSQTAPITSGTGTITGTLLDGESINARYGVDQGGLIEFNSAPVPEASSVVSFGLLLTLGLGGLAMSARRRKAQSAK